MANRKGLLRDWKNLMTDNDLDLNDLNDLTTLNILILSSTEDHIIQAKMARKAGLFFCRERRRKRPQKQEKVAPMTLFTPSEGKNKRGKRQDEREKTRNFLIYFVKILIKRAKTGIERRGICTVLAVQSMVFCRSTAQNYPIDYHYLTNKHHSFPNNFQKPDPVIIGHGHFRSFSFSGAQISPISII